MTDHSGVIPYDPYRGAADLGRLWVLKRGKQELSLYLHTHPLPGWELRLYIDAELRESKTVRTQDAIFDTSDAGSRRLSAKAGLRRTSNALVSRNATYQHRRVIRHLPESDVP